MDFWTPLGGQFSGEIRAHLLKMYWWGMEWDFHDLILGTAISKAEVTGVLRTVSAPAKGGSEGLDVSPEPAGAALPGARAAAGVPSSARAQLGQAAHSWRWRGLSCKH